MNLPEVNVNARPLYEMLYADMKTNLLLTSVRLGVYDLLREPLTADQVAGRLESDPVSTRFFLNGLACLGLLEKKEGAYANTPISETFLVKGLPTYLGQSFLMQSSMRDMMITDLHALVKKGPDPDAKEMGKRSEKQWGRFARSMANNARAGVAQQMARKVSQLPEFPQFKKMLDLGAGPGMFTIAMVGSHPSMKGVVFDRGPSCEAAALFIKEYGLEDRVSTLAGDYNRDEIGQDYDFIWASSTLNFAQSNLDKVMNKIYDALNPGGVFINLSEGLTHESTRPEFYVLCTMAWSIHNQPLKAFDQGVISRAMKEAGFNTVNSRTLETSWGPMDMDIARK